MTDIVTNTLAKNFLGEPKDIRIVTGLSDIDYKNDKGYTSASGIKNYVEDSILALKRRVLGTVPHKEVTERSMVNLRIGRAVHAYGFEDGEKTVNEKFPIFSGTRRGKDWEKFKQDFAQAAELGDILSPSELETVLKLGPVLKKGIDTIKETYANAGYQLVGQEAELSIFAEFEHISLKARIDGVLLFKKDTDLAFTLLEGKTTYLSVSAVGQLSREIQKYYYYMACMVYLHLFDLALRWSKTIPPTWQLGQVSQILGDIRILWLSKESQDCGQTLISHLHDAQELGWQHYGNSVLLGGLAKMKQALEVGYQMIDVAHKNRSKEALKAPLVHVLAQPNKWLSKDIEEVTNLVQPLIQQQWPADTFKEQTIKAFLKKAFRPVIPSLSFAPPPPTKEKEPKKIPVTYEPPVPLSEMTSESVTETTPPEDFPLEKTTTQTEGSKFLSAKEFSAIIRPITKKSELRNMSIVKSLVSPDFPWEGNINAVKKLLRKAFKQTHN